MAIDDCRRLNLQCFGLPYKIMYQLKLCSFLALTANNLQVVFPLGPSWIYPIVMLVLVKHRLHTVARFIK